MNDLKLQDEPGSEVVSEEHGHIGVIRLNRPRKRNALNEEILLRLKKEVERFIAADRCRVLVLTGEGAAFSAGADLTGIASIDDVQDRNRVFAPWANRLAELIRQIVHTLTASRIVTVASVNGPAVGGGWITALTCDFRIASENAVFWFPEIDLGRAVGDPTVDTLLKYLSPPIAKEILMTARRYSAAETLALGLVHRVVPASELARESLRFAEKLANRDSDALAKLKARLNQDLIAIWAPAIPDMVVGQE